MNLSRKFKLLKMAVQVENAFQKQSFAYLRLGVLKNFVNSTGKHLRWRFFLIKRGVSSEICKIFKNTFFYRTATVAAYEV